MQLSNIKLLEDEIGTLEKQSRVSYIEPLLEEVEEMLYTVESLI